MAKPTSSNSKPGTSTRKKVKTDEAVADQAPNSSEEILDAEVVLETSEVAEPEVAEPEQSHDTLEIQSEGSVQDDVTPQVQDVQADVKKPQSSFVPLLLGGALAGAIGFGAAVVYPNLLGTKGDEAQIVAVEDFQALVGRVDALPSPMADADISQMIEQSASSFAEQLAGLERRIEEVSSRLDQALDTPSEAGALSPAALAEYQEEIVALRAELDAQQSSLAQMVDQAASQLEAAQAQSQQFEESAAQVARSATLRLALAKLQAAIETGSPYQAVMPEFTEALGTDVPAAISQNAGDGVPTQAALVADFDVAADSALAVARAEGVDGEERTAFGAFLRSQFDVRSVTPQEGTSVDAILSRAQAALNAARLADALAEVRTLPEVARAEMVNWISGAEARAAVVAAVEELSFSLNDK